jgi:2-polyprenyl-3-methyl-5-hydroxy-6-metoxy-1,4-benzoquinol methylase
MANERGKHLDNTHLSIDQAEARGFIHRDYIAHCLRWTHVAKHLQAGQKYKTAHILDIGCGKEVPLAKLMYSSRLIPETGSYTGLDYNKLEVPAMFHTGKFPIKLHGGMMFPQAAPEDVYTRKFDVITCFEVLEHVEPAQVVIMLKAISGLLAPGGRAFLSTPCYDAKVGAAANHVNEMSYGAFGALIEHSDLRLHPGLPRPA